MDDLSYRVTELERRLANVVLKGSVAEADYAGAKVRVRSGEIVTGWLPWLTGRAGADRTWTPPEVGEQVLVLSPSGEPAAGVAMPALYSDAAPAPADQVEVTRTVMADGSVVEFDRETSAMAITLNPAGLLRITVGPTVFTLSAEGLTLTAPDVDFILGGA